MALADAVAGALRPGQRITWTRADGTPENLTGATITGKLKHLGTGATRAIGGPLVLQDAVNGVFDWTYVAGDVPDSTVDVYYEVQFTATFGSGATPARNFAAHWRVQKSL